jgi:hypothetical protein
MQDQTFYEKINVPSPTLDPIARRDRRMAWRIERNLQMIKCSMTGKDMLSIPYKNKETPVYSLDVWWSDAWDALAYGKSYDFEQSFFAQFGKLLSIVPRLALINDSSSENSEYVNQTTHQKDCYWMFDADYCQQCQYSTTITNSHNSLDCLYAYKLEWCFELIHSHDCYQCFFGTNISNSSDCWLVKDCQRCQNCLGCVNLVGKSYCILNKQYTKEQYQQKIKEAGSEYSLISNEAFKSQYQLLIDAAPKRAKYTQNCDNVTGNYLHNCKNAHYSFVCLDSKDISYCSRVANSTDCMDYDIWGDHAELVYECVTVGEHAYNIHFSSTCWDNVSDLQYCESCMHCSHCFGCIGLRNKSYCILNVQYSKEDYFELLPRIIEHMTTCGEYGEFFPAALSPHAREMTLAHAPDMIIGQNCLPQKTHTVDYKAALGQTYLCPVSHKSFRMNAVEIAFYTQFLLPIPVHHPDVRNKLRSQKLLPMQLWDRTCSQSGEQIWSPYDPALVSDVYSEEVFVKEFY